MNERELCILNVCGGYVDWLLTEGKLMLIVQCLNAE